MKIDSYASQLLTVTALFVLYWFVISYTERTKDQYETRNVLLQVANHGRVSQAVDNSVDSLKAFYTSLLENVELHKLPYGYVLKNFYFETSNGAFDLLDIKEAQTRELDLTGDVRLVIRVYNRGRRVYGGKVDCVVNSTATESSCNIALQPSNYSELSHHVYTSLEFSPHDLLFVLVMCGLPLVTLVYLRNRYTYVLGAVKTAFLFSEIAKRYPPFIKYAGKINHANRGIPFSGYHAVHYVNVASSVLLLAALALIYKVQVDILGKHDAFHTVFWKTLSNATFMCLSLLLVTFLHHVGVHLAYWFIWVPILCCTVMSTVGSLVKNKKENIVGRDITLIRGQGSVEHGRADGVAAGENAKIATLKTIFTPHSIILIGVNLVLTIILIICYFKTVRNVDTIKAMSNVLNQPFRVTAKKHVLTGILSTDRVKLGAQTKSDIVSIGVQHVKSVKSLSIWFKRVVPLVSAIKQICLVANRYGDKAQYVHLDPGKIDGVMAKFKTLQLNVVLIFQTSDADIIYTKLEFGRDFNGAALIDNSSFYSISTKKDILSLVFIVLQIFALMLHLYFDLKTASVFGNRKNILQADVKVKTRISLLIIMCAIDIIHFIGNSVLNFNIPDINDSAAKSRDFDPMVALFERVPSIHKMGKFCIFVNTIFLICYVVTMMPRYCYSFTDNGEIVKQLIFTSANTMAVVLYQYFLLLVSWSIIGNRFFGGSVEHLRNFFTALRYNVIVGFNKFLVHPMSKYLDFYNDVTVMLFYNVGLTSILAIYYFSSLKKKKAVPLETFDKHQDNFRADITVNMDDLVGFKVLVKSVEEHKKFMGTNVTEVDYCKQFFERFPQNTPLGFTRISPKRQVHSCLERIKKYLLCILLLRMRVRNLSLKIGDIDQRSQQRNPINEHKRIYLSMLKEKLHITVEEIERFKRSTEILLAGKGMPGISKVNNADGGATNMGKDGGDRTSDNQDSPLYDISELEKFVMCPVPSDNVIPNTHLVKESGVNVDGPPFNLTDLQEVGETQIYMNREPIEVASETDAGKVHKETASQSSWTSDHPMTIGMAEKVTGKSIDGPNGDGDSRLVHRGIVDNSTTRNASQQDASHQAFFTHGAERVRDGSNGDVAQIYSKIGSLVSSNVEVVAKKSQDIKPDVRDISKSQERVGIDKSRNFNITSNPLESNKTGDLKSDHATPEETESLFEFTDEVRPNTSADAAGCSSQTSVTDNVPCHPDSDKGEKDMFDPLNNECLYKTSVDGALNVVAGTTEGKSKSSDVASSKPRFDKSGQMNATADDKNSGEFYATKGKIGIFRASVLGQK